MTRRHAPGRERPRHAALDAHSGARGGAGPSTTAYGGAAPSGARLRGSLDVRTPKEVIRAAG